MEKQLEDDSRKLGERVAWLVAASNMPHDVKEAWITLIPQMKPEQLDRFVAQLEAHLDDALKTDLKQFAQEFEEAQTKYEESKQALENRALKQLEDIEKLIAQSNDA